MTEQQQNQLAQPARKKYWPLAGWLGLIILWGVVVYVLNQYCRLSPKWLLNILLADYLVLLIINRINWFKKARWIFTLLLTVMPVLAILVTHPWSFWFWVIVVILYLLTLLQHFMRNMNANTWATIIPLTLLLALLIFKLQRWICLS